MNKVELVDGVVVVTDAVVVDVVVIVFETIVNVNAVAVVTDVSVSAIAIAVVAIVNVVDGVVFFTASISFFSHSKLRSTKLLEGKKIN